MIDIQQRPVTLLTCGVRNKSSLLTSDEVRAMIGICNVQLEQDFAPAWGIHWALDEAPTDEALAGYPVQIVIADTVDDPRALGYHLESADGVARCLIGVKPVLDSGGVVLLDESNPQRPSVLSVLSHEVIETAVDTYANQWVIGPERAEGALYAREACDPCEAFQYTLELRGTRGAVSDFVYPAYWDPDAKPGTRLDHLGLCPGPFQLTAGGYAMVLGPGYQLANVTMGDTMRPWKHDRKLTSARSLKRRAHAQR